MHRIDMVGNVSNPFADKNPATGTAGTIVDDDWLNSVQEEIFNVIEDVGTNLTKGSAQPAHKRHENAHLITGWTCGTTISSSLMTMSFSTQETGAESETNSTTDLSRKT